MMLRGTLSILIGVCATSINCIRFAKVLAIIFRFWNIESLQMLLQMLSSISYFAILKQRDSYFDVVLHALDMFNEILTGCNIFKHK